MVYACIAYEKDQRYTYLSIYLFLRKGSKKTQPFKYMKMGVSVVYGLCMYCICFYRQFECHAFKYLSQATFEFYLSFCMK